MSLHNHPRKADAVDDLAWAIASDMCYEAAIDGYGFDEDSDEDVAHFHDLATKRAQRFYDVIADGLEAGQ